MIGKFEEFESHSNIDEEINEYKLKQEGIKEKIKIFIENYNFNFKIKNHDGIVKILSDLTDLEFKELFFPYSTQGEFLKYYPNINKKLLSQLPGEKVKIFTAGSLEKLQWFIRKLPAPCNSSSEENLLTDIKANIRALESHFKHSAFEQFSISYYVATLNRTMFLRLMTKLSRADFLLTLSLDKNSFYEVIKRHSKSINFPEYIKPSDQKTDNIAIHADHQYFLRLMGINLYSKETLLEEAKGIYELIYEKPYIKSDRPINPKGPKSLVNYINEQLSTIRELLSSLAQPPIEITVEPLRACIYNYFRGDEEASRVLFPKRKKAAPKLKPNTNIIISSSKNKKLKQDSSVYGNTDQSKFKIAQSQQFKESNAEEFHFEFEPQQAGQIQKKSYDDSNLSFRKIDFDKSTIKRIQVINLDDDYNEYNKTQFDDKNPKILDDFEELDLQFNNQQVELSPFEKQFDMEPNTASPQLFTGIHDMSHFPETPSIAYSFFGKNRFPDNTLFGNSPLSSPRLFQAHSPENIFAKRSLHPKNTGEPSPENDFYLKK